MLAFLLEYRLLPVFLAYICYICGARMRAPALRIVGGRDAEPGEFPYIVRMEVRTDVITHENNEYYKSRHHCTGAALATNWALTAAHCIDPNEVHIVRFKEQPTQVEVHSSKVISVHIFPTYKNFKAFKYMRNDIAILKTDPMSLTQFGKLSAVDFSTLLGQAATVVGFGETREGDAMVDTKVLQKPLQVAKALIKNCGEDYGLYPNMCLAPSCSDPARICGGDPGGPIIHASGIVGINSLYGENDCKIANIKKRKQGRLSAVMTPISLYIDWIRGVIQADGKTR